TTYFESGNLKISSKGEVMGYADEGHKQFGSLIINEKYEGVTIKHIASRAFDGQTGIDEIILPKTLVSIGNYAFQDIKSPVNYTSDHDPLIPIEWDLSHLIDLESIGEGAFQGKNNKQTLSFNLKNLSKLKIIDYYAFYSRNISSINFEGVTKLETIGGGFL
ncbi:MAG: leucine-rich repeat protein, partial [Mycoplasmataceae bacterium]|nr:leucine-rich repeat protein [Mycoplasmataceae bacterium]